MKNLITLLTLSILIFTNTNFVFAQSPDYTTLSEEELNQLMEAETEAGLTIMGGIDLEPPANTVECFADGRYRFGSVQADIEVNLNGTVAGVPINFKTTVYNENPYPITDTAVYVKIFEMREDSDLRHQNGDVLVDQFFAKEGIALNAYATTTFNFEWKTPLYLKTGKYRAVTYVTTSHRYNLLGLSFTDDVTGNQAEFTVADGMDKVVAWDKDTVQVQGEPYRFAAFTPKLSPTSTVVVSPELVNETNQEQVAVVTWKLYYWDAQRQENLIETKEEGIILAPNQRLRPTYTITDTQHSVYYLVAEAKWLDTTSIVGVRFTREGVDAPRINFPSITKYPLKANEPVELFSCLHNAGTNDVVSNNTLILTLKDYLGNVLHTYTYNGDVTGAMMAVADTYTPTTDHASFSLTATLKQGDKVIDETITTYDCYELGVECPVAPVASEGVNKSIIVSILVLVILILGFITIKLRRSNSVDNTNDNPTDTIGPSSAPLMLLLVLVGSVFLGGVGEVEAKSVGENVPYNTTYNSMLFYLQDPAWNMPEFKDSNRAQKEKYFWSSALYSIGVEIRRNSFAKSNNVNINDGDTVSVGDVLTFEAPVKNTDITWFGTGYSNDTPYGVWVPDAENSYNYTPIVATNHSDRGVFYGFSVNPSNITYTQNGTPLARLSCDATGKTCTVLSAGQIKVQINYSETYGRFYYSHWVYSPDGNYYNAYSGGSGGVSNIYRVLHAADPNPIKNGVSVLNLGVSPGGICRVGHLDIFRFDGKTGYPGFCMQETPFNLEIPNQQIEFTFNAVSPSNPPTPPTITPDSSNSNLVGQNQTFSFYATDPDNDNIVYGIDWDMNNTVDQWLPSSGDVSSGTTLPTSRSFNTIGSKTFQALTKDSNGAQSGWTTHTVVVNSLPPPVVTLTANPTTVNVGGTTNLSWTVSGANNCIVSSNPAGGWLGGATRPATNNSEQSNSLNTAGTQRFNLSCSDSSGQTTTAFVDVNVVNIPSVTLNGSACPIQIGNNTCTTNDIGWTFTNAVAPYSVRNTTNNYLIGNTSTGNDEDAELKYGPNTLIATDSAGNQQNLPLTANCVSGASIHPVAGVCTLAPDPDSIDIDITATPKTVRRGNKSNLAIDITSTEALNCRLYGATNDSPKLILNNQLPPVNPINVETKPLNFTQEVLVKCEVANFTTVTKSEPALIEVEGDIQEI